MTLPTNIILPEPNSDAKDINWMKEMVYTLQDMYEDLAQGINGDIRQFTPTISGTGTAGAGTYDHQIGWYLRQGIMVDIWFDVKWSAHTGTTNVFLDLPYKVFNTRGSGETNKPFVGILQPDSVTFATGTAAVINAIPDTLRGEIWEYGSGIASANVAIAGTGQLTGSIRYIGTEFER